MDPDKSHEEAEKRPQAPGRLRQTWHALMGRPVVPQAIRAEWAVWQIELENLCDKVTAAAARAYERDRTELRKAKKKIEELEARAAAGDVQGDGWDTDSGSWHPHKRAMNRLVLERRGVKLPAFTHRNGEAANVDGTESEQS